MSFSVLVADPLADEGLKILKDSPLEVVDGSGWKAPELLEKLPKFDALVVRSRTEVDEKMIATGRNLKVIGRAGIGVDNVNVPAATRAGVVVMNTPEGNATTTAEHAISLMMALARHIPQASASLKAGVWEKKKYMGRELRGKTLGIIGLGNIGKLVAERALGLRMQVVGFDPFFSAEAANKLGVESVTLEELVRRSDVITVHAPLTEDTRNLIGDAQIDKMKKDVMLINCARGGIYDEAALLRGLNSGKISGVALDVFTAEPPPPDHPLVKHERVICTPHLGASTKEAQVQVSIAIAEQLIEFASGLPARNAVNLPAISAGELKLLAPYINLAERMGAFCAQLSHDRSIKRIHVELGGVFPERSYRVLTPCVVAGALRHAFDHPVNTVNAKVLAEDRGLEIVESHSSKGESGYENALRVTVEATSESHTVLGTLFKHNDGRIVEVDGIRVEAIPEGYLLVVANYDRPGVVGLIGTVLAEAKVNISNMHLGLNKATGKAFSVVGVDQPVPSEVMQKLSGGNVISVHLVKL